METWLFIVGGLLLLVAGGELLVRGSVQVASQVGVSPLVISLTLVGFGTSAPELVTSVQAALRGSSGIAYGNIVGSNIANLLLILGVSASLSAIAVGSNALRRDTAVMVAAIVIFAAIGFVAPMNRLVGAVFLAGLAVYVLVALRQERVAAGGHGAVYDKSLATQEADPGLTPGATRKPGIGLSLLTALAGLGLVVLGGFLLVRGAVTFALESGVSEAVVGLTIVALGTSLPELVTSAVAAIRKHGDVAFGNIVGSSVYNILGIGGATALIAPSEIPAAIARFDSLVMIGASLVVAVFAFTGRIVNRWEGGALVVAYAAYLAWLWP